MKKWIKYITSTVVFSVIYTITEYLLTENISWKMVVATSIIYFILYTTIDLTFKKTKKDN